MSSDIENTKVILAPEVPSEANTTAYKPPTYTPSDWYWRRSDGALFSSRRIKFVSEEDEEYLLWKKGEAGRHWSIYPRDENGEESASALQALLPSGVFASLENYASGVRYEAEISGVEVSVGGEMVRVSTARDNRDGMRDTMLRLLTGLRIDGDVLKIFTDGVSRPATNAEAQSAIAAASTHVQEAFNLEELVVADIKSGKITAVEEVDEAFA